MRRALAVAGMMLAMIVSVIACSSLEWLSPHEPQSAELGALDRAVLVEEVQARFEGMSRFLAETTGDRLDFVNLRFFSATNLNGADETVVIVPLTEDSPSYQLALQSEEAAPLAGIAPLPLGGMLPLDPCTAFHSLENNVAYLFRAISYEDAEIVDEAGERIRMATEFSWNRGGNDPEWYMYRGNTVIHFQTCATIRVNNG